MVVGMALNKMSAMFPDLSDVFLTRRIKVLVDRELGQQSGGSGFSTHTNAFIRVATQLA